MHSCAPSLFLGRLGVDAFFFISLPLCFVRLGVYAFFFSSLPLCFVRLGVYAFFFSPPTIILTHLGLFQKSFLHRKIFSRKCLKINNFYFYAQLALKSGRFSAYFFPYTQYPLNAKRLICLRSLYAASYPQRETIKVSCVFLSIK